MTKNEGKSRKRQSLMEGFNNVPKILEEARRMVDEVTQTGEPADPTLTQETLPRETAAAEPPSLETPTKPKKPASKKGASQEMAQPKSRTPKKAKPKRAVTAPVPEVALATETPLEKPAALEQPKLPPENFGISIKHRVPGRTRLEIAKMKYNEPFARIVEERLAVVPGITAVETSTVTASAVVYYNPRELCKPSALSALQEAWQDLFPRMKTETLITAMTCQAER